MGTWITYGLGSENQSLPAFVVIYDGHGGTVRWICQLEFRLHARGLPGTVFRAAGLPIIDLKPPDSVLPEQQRARLDLLDRLNELDAQRFPGNSE